MQIDQDAVRCQLIPNLQDFADRLIIWASNELAHPQMPSEIDEQGAFGIVFGEAIDMGNKIFYAAQALAVATAEIERLKLKTQGFVIVPREPTEVMIEAACRAHCDYFGGAGWWDSGLIADTKPKAIEAMQAAYAAMIDAGKGEG